MIQRPGKSTTSGQWNRKCVAKLLKTPCFRVKTDRKISTLGDTIVSNKGRDYGAADGTRTRTVSLPGDFKSPVSTDSTTAATSVMVTYFFSYVKGSSEKLLLLPARKAPWDDCRSRLRQLQEGLPWYGSPTGR